MGQKEIGVVINALLSEFPREDFAFARRAAREEIIKMHPGLLPSHSQRLCVRPKPRAKARHSVTQLSVSGSVDEINRLWRRRRRQGCFCCVVCVRTFCMLSKRTRRKKTIPQMIVIIFWNKLKLSSSLQVRCVYSEKSCSSQAKNMSCSISFGWCMSCLIDIEKIFKIMKLWFSFINKRY